MLRYCKTDKCFQFYKSLLTKYLFKISSIVSYMEQVRLIIQERLWSKRTYAIQHKIGSYMKRITMSLRCTSCLVLKVRVKMMEYWLRLLLMEKKNKATSFFWMQSHLKRLIEHICHILFHGLPMECTFPKQNLLCNRLKLQYFEYYDCHNNNDLASRPDQANIHTHQCLE